MASAGGCHLACTHTHPYRGGYLRKERVCAHMFAHRLMMWPGTFRWGAKPPSSVTVVCSVVEACTQALRMPSERERGALQAPSAHASRTHNTWPASFLRNFADWPRRNRQVPAWVSQHPTYHQRVEKWDPGPTTHNRLWMPVFRTAAGARCCTKHLTHTHTPRSASHVQTRRCVQAWATRQARAHKHAHTPNNSEPAHHTRQSKCKCNHRRRHQAPPSPTLGPCSGQLHPAGQATPLQHVPHHHPAGREAAHGGGGQRRALHHHRHHPDGAEVSRVRETGRKRGSTHRRKPCVTTAIIQTVLGWAWSKPSHKHGASRHASMEQAVAQAWGQGMCASMGTRHVGMRCPRMVVDHGVRVSGRELLTNQHGRSSPLS